MPAAVASGEAVSDDRKGCRPRGSNRVNRGGNWNNNAQNCRVSNRNNNNPDNRNNNIGFRLVLRSLWHEEDSRL